MPLEKGLIRPSSKGFPVFSMYLVHECNMTFTARYMTLGLSHPNVERPIDMPNVQEVWSTQLSRFSIFNFNMT
jgi:hypothetical protein